MSKHVSLLASGYSPFFGPIWRRGQQRAMLATSSGSTPADILGAKLLADWDAEVASSLTLSGSTVTTWTDQVAGYAATQAFASQKPVINATAINGRPAVVADGTDDYLEPAVFPAGLPTGSDECEIWLLCSQNDVPGNTTARRAVSWGGGNTTDQVSVTRAVTGGVNNARLNIRNGVTDETTVDFTGAHVIRAMVSTTPVIEVDGVASAPGSTSVTTGSTIFRLFAHQVGSPSLFWLGGINRCLITDPLDTDEADFLRNYLKARGGIA